MANKLFIFNRLITQSGFIGGGRDNAFEISNLDKVRVVVENAGGTNEFTFRVKIKGQSSFTTLTTVTGNVNSLLDVKTYDLLQIECTVFDGPTVFFSSTGYKIGSSAPTEYANFAAFPAPTGSGDLAWASSTSLLYYDEPSSETWKVPSAGTVSLTDQYIAYGDGSNQLTGESNFRYNTTSNTLIVDNIEVGGTALLNVLYRPEDVITLTNTDITNKSITLSGTPTDVTKTRLDVRNAPTQTYGVDFTVSGTTLSWNGLGLDGILEAGDQVMVTFN